MISSYFQVFVSFYSTSNSPVLDSMSFCTIELSIGLVLYLKDINPTTALICILKKESKINEGKNWNWERANKSIDYFFLALMDVNLNILKNKIQELFHTNLSRQQLNTSSEWLKRCCLLFFVHFFNKWNHRRLKSNTVFSQ